jgi:cytochrome P450
VQYLVSRYYVSREHRRWAANRALYPEANLLGPSLDFNFIFLEMRHLGDAEWEQALRSHAITLQMAAQAGDWHTADDFVTARQHALESQLESFLQQRCEWDFEDTPPLDSLVLEDEDEAEELSDDESAGLR